MFTAPNYQTHVHALFTSRWSDSGTKNCRASHRPCGHVVGLKGNKVQLNTTYIFALGPSTGPSHLYLCVYTTCDNVCDDVYCLKHQSNQIDKLQTDSEWIVNGLLSLLCIIHTVLVVLNI